MAGEVYLVKGTPIVWTDSGGDEELNINSLAADGALGGSYYDRGSSAAPDEYEFELIIDGFTSSPTTNESVELYFTQSDGTTGFDGQLTTDPTDAADTATGPTTGMLKNMLFAGSAIVHSTTSADELQIRGTVRLTGRYFSPVVHNNTAIALAAAASHSVTLTPIYYQAQ